MAKFGPKEKSFEITDDFVKWLFPTDGSKPRNKTDIQKYMDVTDKTFKKLIEKDELLNKLVERSCLDYADWIVNGMIQNQIDFRVGSFILRCGHGWMPVENQIDLARKERELQHRIEMDKLGDNSKEKPPINISFSIATKDNLQVSSDECD